MMRPATAMLLPVLLCMGFTDAAEPEIWSVTGGDGRVRDFLLWPDGGAVVVSGGRNADARGLRGFWHGTKNSRLVMLESGSSAEIRIDRSTIKEFPDESEVNARGNSPHVSPIGDDSAQWLGAWIWHRPNAAGLRYVALISDGSAFADSDTPGRWVPVARGVRVEWHDGAIDLLQFDEAGAALRSWPRGASTKANRPEPTRPQRVGSSGFLVSP